MFLLSVIVPVYNTSKYLKQCIDSIINQTYFNLEIILINDGSTDESGKLCDSYALSDSRVKVIHQQNQGVTAARKKGLMYAVGEYVIFVDSDDYIDKTLFENLTSVAEDCDLVTSGLFLEQKEVFDKIEQGVYIGEEKMKYIIDNMIIYKCGLDRGLTPYIVNKLFKTDYAKKIINEMNTDIFYGEDSEFLYRYVLECNSVCVTGICGYHYVMRENSVTHTIHENYLININALYLSLKNVFCQYEKKESLIIQLQIWMSIMIKLSPIKMGFSAMTRLFVRTIFPLYEQAYNKSIILYGAGSIGLDYYLQLINRKDIKLIAWTDKNFEYYQGKNYPVILLNDALRYTYDYIVIAVKCSKLMTEIKNELINKGIPENKIIWKAPISLIL